MPCWPDTFLIFPCKTPLCKQLIITRHSIWANFPPSVDQSATDAKKRRQNASRCENFWQTHAFMARNPILTRGRVKVINNGLHGFDGLAYMFNVRGKAPEVRKNTDGGANPRYRSINKTKAPMGRQRPKHVVIKQVTYSVAPSGLLLLSHYYRGFTPPSVVFRLFET